MASSIDVDQSYLCIEMSASCLVLAKASARREEDDVKWCYEMIRKPDQCN